ncbi:MAG TPA: divalent metal cation transporter [Longimicrobiales bacterium]|nr:divalent metal cation transporter [Longimicrobiales bacterium]
MKKLLEIALGVVTSIGGYLDAGTIATAAAAGALFGFDLLWVIPLGTLCAICLVEMSGRLSAVSRHTLRDAMRERLGFDFFVLTLVLGLVVDVSVLAAELGGMAIAAELLTGIAFRWWALPAAVLTWLILWKGTFGVIEKGVALLGLVTVSFLAAAWTLHPPVGALARGLVPSLGAGDRFRYWFLAVAILGSLISPYLFYFYSSGAVEEKWDESYLGVNRIVATLGMAFGGIIAMAVLVVAAMVFHPNGIRVERYEQATLLLTAPFGRAGFYLFAASLGIACLGAALELALAVGYDFAQGFGWRWGQNRRPRDAARFALVYTGALAVAAIPIALGVDPLGVTVLSMAFTALVLPFVVLPFLALMNDRGYLREHTNHRLANAVVLAVVVLAFVLAVVSIPLQILGGG